MMALLMGVLAASGGAAALEKTFEASSADGANASSYTFTAADLGDADATREVFVTIALRVSVARTVTAVTIGGVSATLETQFNSASTYGLLVAHASVPSGATGDVAVTLSGTALSCSIAVYRVVNRAVSGAGETDTNTVTPNATTTASISGIDVNADGFVLSAIMWGNTMSGPSLSGLGGAVDGSQEPDAGNPCAFGSTPLQASGSTANTLTWTWTTSRSGFAAAWAF